jgi:energy-coupling factor transporter ATP-binding protein EcfA2/energy-coupling factor transporter transmembrane protein EcfT
VPRLDLNAVTLEAAGAERPLLGGVSLAVEAGEIVAVIGASGAGKSTLLEAAAGLRAPSAGACRVDGSVAIAFQSPERLFFEPLVAEEIGFALRQRGLADAERRARATETLARVGLDGAYLDRHPLALSGGEQRLVALASVLVAKPALLILDEPTAGLAPGRVREVIALLVALRSRGTAVLVATHEMETFAPVADRVVALHRGSIVATGRPAEVFAPSRALQLVGLGVPVPIEAEVAARLAGDTPTAPTETIEGPPPRAAAERPGRIPLPSVGAGMLGGVLIALSFFLAAPLPLLAATALAVLILGHLGGVEVRRLGRMLLPVAILGVLAAGAHLVTNAEGVTLLAAGPVTVTSGGMEAGARTWLRLAGPVLVALSLAGARPPAEVARELRALLERLPLARRMAAGTGLAVLLVARLAPLARDEVRRIERAQWARGGAHGRGGILGRARLLVSIAVPAIIGTLLRAQRLALALELRGWSAAVPGARGGSVVRRADAAWLAAAGGILVATVLAAG